MSHYVTLGVPDTASADDIRVAYRAKARLLHPDVSKRDSTAEFQALQAAHEVLSDPEKRAQYDLSRKIKTNVAPSTLVDIISQAMGAEDAFGMFHGTPKKSKKTGGKRSRNRRMKPARVEIDELPDGMLDDDSMGGIF